MALLEVLVAAALFQPALPVVELFTSQGCSSCPPADRLLSSLEDSRAVVLAFHVDYWDSMGWRDPFGSAESSRRQREYAAAFASNRVYTPQAIVNGRREGVGSDRDWLLAEIGRAPVRFEMRGTARFDADRLVALAEARPRDGQPGDGVSIHLALTESGLSTDIPRGENARKTLRNDHVVRALNRGPRADFALDPAWSRQRLRVVAFLQDSESRAIHGGLELRPER